jgi:alpha-glucosidase (family GH31 glycosyl hydrolase)
VEVGIRGIVGGIYDFYIKNVEKWWKKCEKMLEKCWKNDVLGENGRESWWNEEVLINNLR